MLVLGGGAGGVINEILKHPSVKLVDYAELDPLLLELIRQFPTPLTEKELNDPRVRIKHIDGRMFLKITENKYDIILVGATEPSDLQTNRFFTKEFFTLANEKLRENGILVIALPGSLIYLSEELRDLNASIFNTLKEVFPYVSVIPGEGTNLFLSSNSNGISILGNTVLIDRLSERRLETGLIVPWHIEFRLHPRWVEWFSGFIEEGSQRINYDFRPIGMFYNISRWNALLSPYLRSAFRWFGKINLQMFVVLFLVFVSLFFLLRSKNIKPFGTGIPLCTATTGFSGMMFDLALIFTFQAIYGYVFAWVGLLIASFMAGAGCGAMIITSVLHKIKNDFKVFKITELLIICFAFGLPLIFLFLQPYLGRPGLFLWLKVLFLLLAFISGLLVGAQFPIANQMYLKNNTDLSRTAGLLYGTDLLGGYIGGILGGVILLPVLGLMGSCIVVVLLKLSSFIVITYQKR